MHERDLRYLGEFGQKVSKQTDFNEWIRYLACDGIQSICPFSYKQDLTDEQRTAIRFAVSSGTLQVFENRLSKGLTLEDSDLDITDETLRVVEEYIVDNKVHTALAEGLAQGMAEAGLIDEDWEKHIV